MFSLAVFTTSQNELLRLIARRCSHSLYYIFLTELVVRKGHKTHDVINGYERT